MDSGTPKGAFPCVNENIVNGQQPSVCTECKLAPWFLDYNRYLNRG